MGGVCWRSVEVPGAHGQLETVLEANDRPQGTCGQDPRSEDFRASIMDADLQEMGPMDCGYIWRGNRALSPYLG